MAVGQAFLPAKSCVIAIAKELRSTVHPPWFHLQTLSQFLAGKNACPTKSDFALAIRLRS
jgi:hypothetical protein